jgi:hypothetical protein
MAMTVKHKLMLLWVFVLIVIGFAAHHFLGGLICAFQNIIAMGVGFTPVVAKLGTIFFGMHF